MNSRLYSSFVFLLLALNMVGATEGIDFRDSSNQVLEKQISGQFAMFTQKFFKYDGSLTLNNTIILYVLFVMVLLMLLNITQLIPFFHNKASSFIAAIVMSLLVAFSGGFIVTLEFLSSLAGLFTSTWTNIVLLFIVVVIVIILVSVSSLLRKLQNSDRIAEAERRGMKLGSDAAFSRKKSED